MTTIVEASRCRQSSARANGTVSPSAMPITMSRTVAVAEMAFNVMSNRHSVTIALRPEHFSYNVVAPAPIVSIE